MVRSACQHGGQVGLELLHRGAEVGDLLALEAEEQLEQLLQLGGVGHVAAQHFFLVLDEHGGAVVAEDDVVLRVALLELLGDLFVEVVGGVLGLPVAQRHAQLVQQRAIDSDVGLVVVLSGYSARKTRSCWRPQALSRSLNASRTMVSRWLPLARLMRSSCLR
jgi:hypothetical protein